MNETHSKEQMKEHYELFNKTIRSTRDIGHLYERSVLHIDDYAWSITIKRHGLINKKTPIRKTRLPNSKSVEGKN